MASNSNSVVSLASFRRYKDKAVQFEKTTRAPDSNPFGAEERKLRLTMGSRSPFAVTNLPGFGDFP